LLDCGFRDRVVKAAAAVADVEDHAAPLGGERRRQQAAVANGRNAPSPLCLSKRVTRLASIRFVPIATQRTAAIQNAIRSFRRRGQQRRRRSSGHPDTFLLG
jgi:hypothetical protein